jgi:hypothetical protein
MAKDPFKNIAGPGKSSAKSSNKIAAAVTGKIKKAVDAVINIKAKLKQLKAELDVTEQTIIDHVSPQQEIQARQGNYAKSFSVEGNTGALTYVTQDKFSIEKSEEVFDAIRQLLGGDFDTYMAEKRTITLKPVVQDNAVLINKIVKAVTDAGIDIGDAFEVKDILVSQKGLDEKQYEMDANLLAEFKTLVRQYKPALK